MRTLPLRKTLIVLGAAALCFAAPKEKGRAPAIPEDLVWPGPPDTPRVRFVGAIRGSDDVTGKAKSSLAERLAGRSAARGRMTLQKPYGIAVDGAERIYVADPAQRAILIFDRNGRTTTQWRGNAQFPLFVPVGLALEEGGPLYVSDSFGSQVVVFNAAGKAVAGFGRGTLKRPGGVALDSARGRLYVADVKLNQVFVFDTRAYKLIQTMGVGGRSTEFRVGVFSAPSNLAVDSKGNLYVSDTYNCRIQVFDPDYKPLRVFGAQGVQPGSFVRPKGIAIDSEDHVYVVDAEFNNFQIFTSEGKPLLFVGSLGDQPGQFLLPTGLAIDRKDRIYVTEQRMTGGRLQIFQYLREKPGLRDGN